MFGPHPDDMAPLATIPEAINEWAWIVGRDVPERAWLLSDYDTWEVNPHYVGPPQPHPEDWEDEEEGDGANQPRGELNCPPLGDDEPRLYVDEDLPF